MSIIEWAKQHHKPNKHSGFTIVELLIVVVVIGILAAIVTVAYTGITSRANNAKTLAAVNSWAAAIQLYRADTGSFPNQQSCLGSLSTYDGTGYCWDGTYWEVRQPFLTQMEPYISTYPEPDTTPVNSGAPQRRGAFYYIPSSTVHLIRAFFTGTTTCPSSSAGPVYSTTVQSTTNVYCQYRLD